MSNVFFFRLHKLRRTTRERAAGSNQQQQQQQQGAAARLMMSSSSGANKDLAGLELEEGGSSKTGDGMKQRFRRRLSRPKVISGFNCPLVPEAFSGRSSNMGGIPVRFFEKPTTMDPSDSLDYVALQIPR